MMSRPQSFIEGEAPDSQHAKSKRGSKVTTERVALLVLCILLAAALIVIYRLYDPCYKCEEGWELHGGKCYYFSIRKYFWKHSRYECGVKGGDLVKIDSREEQTFLERRLRDVMNEAEDKFWIGLTDSAVESRWVWVDGSPLNERLPFWSNYEPDNWTGRNGTHPDGEDCVSMGEKGGAKDLKCWFDAFCSKPCRSICEKAAVKGQIKKVCV
ncbi:hepatic lectin isoform X2 [Oreochromis niloticus]|uniref:hepatic lectin isoform X2 n=1 Tax=Oreochromis niloticus TaxID=8128 RepID=UPI000905D737|nr:hepatic lectin isoform X2 [Oreochromis niloticus]